MLHEDLDDCKAALHLMSNKYKDLQRDLNFEKLKNARAEGIAQEIQKEKKAQKNLVDISVKLKERYMKLLSVLRKALLSDPDDLHGLIVENHKLREILALSAEPQEVKETHNIEEHKETLKNYKARRAEQKTSKSFGVSSRKNYLLVSPKESRSNSGVWDSFFNKHARKG